MRSAFRARAHPSGMQPVGRVSARAIRVMAEVGVDITSHWSKGLDAWSSLTFDYVVTLCDVARQYCPSFPAETRMVHHPIPDPSGMLGTDEQTMLAFRRVREMIRLFVMSLPEGLEQTPPASGR